MPKSVAILFCEKHKINRSYHVGKNGKKQYICKECKNEKARINYRIRNPDIRPPARLSCAKHNIQKTKIIRRKGREKNEYVCKKCRSEYTKKYEKKIARVKSKKERGNKYRKELYNCYVRRLFGNGEVPGELIDLKRCQLLLKKTIRNL